MSHNSFYRVLFVDDDPDEHLLLEDYVKEIRRFSVELQCVSDATECLRLCKENPPDVAIVDNQLGSLTGVELVSDLRRQRFGGGCIMLTGFGDEALAVEALKNGVDDYLQKSRVTGQVLERAIGNAAEKARLRQEIASKRQRLLKSHRRLKKHNREIHGFYHTLSHELKTPLTAAREFISIMLDGIGGEPSLEHREFLEIARSSCDQMRRHLDDLLDASRLDTRNITLDRKPIALSGILRQCIQVLGATTGRSLTLLLDAPSEELIVNADGHRLTQVLTNLLNNAVKFTPPGGDITVRAEVDGPHAVTVSVVDTGCGIDQVDMERIFERLYRGRSQTDEVGGGLGLGLSICKGLVELHGGRIGVESQPGEGTKFWFTIPLAQPSHSSSQPRSIKEAANHEQENTYR